MHLLTVFRIQTLPPEMLLKVQCSISAHRFKDHLSLAQTCRSLADLYNNHTFWSNLCTSLGIGTPAYIFQPPFNTWGPRPSGRTLLVSLLRHGNHCNFPGCCSLLQRWETPQGYPCSGDEFMWDGIGQYFSAGLQEGECRQS
jgi:F-box-like